MQYQTELIALAAVLAAMVRDWWRESSRHTEAMAAIKELGQEIERLAEAIEELIRMHLRPDTVFATTHLSEVLEGQVVPMLRDALGLLRRIERDSGRGS